MPPTWMTLPMSYMAAVETGPTFGASAAVLAFRCGSLNGMAATEPLPFGSSSHIFSDEMPKTLPLGATQARGYHHRLFSGPNASRLLAPKRLFHFVPS